MIRLHCGSPGESVVLQPRLPDVGGSELLSATLCLFTLTTVRT